MSGMKDDGAHTEERQPLPRWKKFLLVMALALVGLGGVLEVSALLYEDGGRTVTQDVGVRPSTPARTSDSHEFFADSEDRWERSAPRTEESAREGFGSLGEWSPSLVKGGFGFFLGFCVGYALRTFFRIGAVVVGLVLIVFLGLSYTGVLPPLDWSGLEGPFNRLAESIQAQASGFQAFLAGNLPSAGLSGLGVFTGIKKN